MFEDHRFDRIIAMFHNKVITLEQYCKAYHYLVNVKTTI